MAEDEKSDAGGPRRAFKNLPPLQTTSLESAPQTSRWRRSRPVVPVVPLPEHNVAPPPQSAPQPQAKLEHRKSSMSLFNLFSRPRVERARGHHESGLPTIPDIPEAKPTTALSPVTATPHNTLSKPMEPRAPTPKSRGGSFNRRSRTGGSHWEPPPLFQAYPQAIKHATLQATSASAEAIIQTQAHKRQYSLLRENLQSKLDLSAAGEEGPEKLQKREKRMSTSSSQGTPELTQKVYVLATSGYILQYSGEGPSDRMPEKMLQLGKDSAAFACDLIPGKHWVLQISQAAKDDGTVTAQQPRSFLSRLRMQGATAKKTATSLLLVFDSPEEMGSWLTAIRREIDILAGRRRRSDFDQEHAGNGERKLTKVPSHRYMVQRDPSRFDSDRSPLSSPVGSPANPGADWPSARMNRNVSDATSTTSRFASKRQSMEASSMATSYEQTQLNQLRESSRLSMASNRTSGTSPGTSTGPPSPVRDITPLPENEAQRSPTALKSFSMSPNANSRRRSMPMQPLSPTNEGQLPVDGRPVRTQRHSTFGAALNGAHQSPAPPSDDRSTLSPTPTAEPPRPLKNRMSFSRPFNLQTSHIYTPMPTIRSSSAPPDKMSVPAGQAVSTDSSERVRPPSTIGGLPSAAALSSHSVNRQTPSPNPGFRPVPIRPSSYLPPRRLSSLGPSLPVNVNPTPALQHRASQPQLHHPQPQLQPPTRPPTEPLPPVPSQPPTNPLPPLPQQQPQHTQQPALRRPASMQIRSEPAAFLSTRRPMGVSSRNRSPSIEPPLRPASAQAGPQAAQAGTSTPEPQPRLMVHPRRSMPVLGLPPPAPPPNVPLPAPPPNVPLPSPPSSASQPTVKTAVMA